MFVTPSPGHAEQVRDLLARHRRPSPPTALPCSLTFEDERATVAPVGRLDRSTVAILDAVLSDVHGRGFAQVVVDLRGLSFIDAAGIGLLLRWAAVAGRKGRELRLQPGSDRAELAIALNAVVEKHRVARV